MTPKTRERLDVMTNCLENLVSLRRSMRRVWLTNPGPERHYWIGRWRRRHRAVLRSVRKGVRRGAR